MHHKEKVIIQSSSLTLQESVSHKHQVKAYEFMRKLCLMYVSIMVQPGVVDTLRTQLHMKHPQAWYKDFLEKLQKLTITWG